MSHFYFKKCFHCFSYWYTQHVLLQFMLIGFFGCSCIYIYMYVCIHTCSIWRFLIDILIFHFGALPCSYFHFNTLGIISNKLREKKLLVIISTHFYWTSFKTKSLSIISFFTGHHFNTCLVVLAVWVFLSRLQLAFINESRQLIPWGSRHVK